jgi:hypothetical protein
MKKILSLCVALALLPGCSLLMPKNVELFQKKVQAFPEESNYQRELMKRAAQLNKDVSQQVVAQALIEKSSPRIVVPATDAAHLADAVSVALGPPVTAAKPTALPDEIAGKLLSTVGKFDNKVQEFKLENNEVAGKKIEGTGLFQIPYFAWMGMLAMIVFVVWHLGKTALSAASVAGGAGAPAAMVGLGAMNVTSNLAGKAVNQLVSGGQRFLAWLESSEAAIEPSLRAKITDAFKASHKTVQDTDVKSVVNTLIDK